MLSGGGDFLCDGVEAGEDARLDGGVLLAFAQVVSAGFAGVGEVVAELGGGPEGGAVGGVLRVRVRVGWWS